MNNGGTITVFDLNQYKYSLTVSGTLTPTNYNNQTSNISSMGSHAGTVAGTINSQIIEVNQNKEINSFVKINPLTWQIEAGFNYKNEKGTVTRG